MPAMEHQTALLETIRLQRAGFVGLGSPFYAALADELAADVVDDGPMARVLAPFADAPFEAAYVLRMFGGVHRMVLSGAAPALAAHYPSTGGDGDARAAGSALRELLASSHWRDRRRAHVPAADERGRAFGGARVRFAGDRRRVALAASTPRDRIEWRAQSAARRVLVRARRARLGRCRVARPVRGCVGRRRTAVRCRRGDRRSSWV